MKALRLVIVLVVIAGIGIGAYIFALKTSLIWKEDVDEEMYKVRGVAVDASHGEIDWYAVKQRGNVSFALIRATEGSAFKDANFAKNYVGAIKAGLRVSLYHDYKYGSGGQAQGQYYINNVKVKGMELKPTVRFMFDVSTLTEDDIKLLHSDILIMFEMLQKNYTKNPMIYTTEDIYNVLFKDTSAFDVNNIVVENQKHKPMIMDASRWDFWQYKTDGKVEGIPKPVNKLVYTGTPGDFENYIAHTK